MKIVKLEAQNVKRLKAVEITPQGNTVVIGGRNGQGKTSPDEVRATATAAYAYAATHSRCAEIVRAAYPVAPDLKEHNK